MNCFFLHGSLKYTIKAEKQKWKSTSSHLIFFPINIVISILWIFSEIFFAYFIYKHLSNVQQKSKYTNNTSFNTKKKKISFYSLVPSQYCSFCGLFYNKTSQTNHLSLFFFFLLASSFFLTALPTMALERPTPSKTAVPAPPSLSFCPVFLQFAHACCLRNCRSPSNSMVRNVTSL